MWASTRLLCSRIRDQDEAVGGTDKSADNKGLHPSLSQRLLQLLQAVRRNGDQEATGGLRVAAEVHQGFIHICRDLEAVADELAVSFHGSGNDSSGDGFGQRVEIGG